MFAKQFTSKLNGAFLKPIMGKEFVSGNRKFSCFFAFILVTLTILNQSQVDMLLSVNQ